MPCSNATPAASEENRADECAPSLFPRSFPSPRYPGIPGGFLMTRKLRDACWGYAASSLQGLALDRPRASSVPTSCSALCHSQYSKRNRRIRERSIAPHAEQECPQAPLLRWWGHLASANMFLSKIISINVYRMLLCVRYSVRNEWAETSNISREQ